LVRLNEVPGFLTGGRRKPHRFILEPLTRSKPIFDEAPKAQQGLAPLASPTGARALPRDDPVATRPRRS
jgi:hypothetical protein